MLDKKCAPKLLESVVWLSNGDVTSGLICPQQPKATIRRSDHWKNACLANSTHKRCYMPRKLIGTTVGKSSCDITHCLWRRLTRDMTQHMSKVGKNRNYLGNGCRELKGINRLLIKNCGLFFEGKYFIRWKTLLQRSNRNDANYSTTVSDRRKVISEH